MPRSKHRRPTEFLRQMATIYFQRQVSRSAAELAYFLILSFFPLLLCLNAFVGRLNVEVASLLHSVSGLLPADGVLILQDYLAYLGQADSTGLVAAGLSMTILSSSAAYRALMNISAEISQCQGLTGLHQIVASLLYSLLFMAVICVSVVVLLTGDWFFALVQEWIPPIAEIGELWLLIRFLLLFGIVLLFVLLLYHTTAPRGWPRARILGGALLASVSLVLSSALFSWFIGLSTRYALVYGSLASVIILLLWLYLCGNILILGSVFNFVRQHPNAPTKKPPP